MSPRDRAQRRFEIRDRQARRPGRIEPRTIADSTSLFDSSVPLLQRYERALAIAHAALDEDTERYAVLAKQLAAELLPNDGRSHSRAVPLSEAHRLVDLVTRLRAVIALLDRKLALADEQPTS